MTTPLDTIFSAIQERIRATARAETVYGETRTVEGRSIIPVARVSYGFGAGSGRAPTNADEEAETTPRHGGQAGGGGGGGGVSVSPVGFLVVTPEGERFVPIALPRRKLAVAGFLGFALGYVLCKTLLR